MSARLVNLPPSLRLSEGAEHRVSWILEVKLAGTSREVIYLHISPKLLKPGRASEQRPGVTSWLGHL